MESKEVSFESGGTVCRGRHFPPVGEAFPSDAGTPCVVLGHSLGGTVDAGLVPYAEHFAAAGLHALAFDYRHFGRSDGQPRQLVSIERQIDDWAAAIGHARDLAGVDPARIALWGTALSGGLAVTAAVNDGRVAAVVAQCPMFDGLGALRNLLAYAGYRQAMRLTVHGLRDLARGLLRLPPVTMPVVGAPGSPAAMSTVDAREGYLRIAPPDWRNEVCARAMLRLGGYRPGFDAGRLPCRILIQVCEHDTLLPVAPAAAAARRAGERAQLLRYPIGHFDIYVGTGFERAVADQTAFLRRVLAAPAASG